MFAISWPLVKKKLIRLLIYYYNTKRPKFKRMIEPCICIDERERNESTNENHISFEIINWKREHRRTFVLIFEWIMKKTYLIQTLFILVVIFRPQHWKYARQQSTHRETSSLFKLKRWNYILMAVTRFKHPNKYQYLFTRVAGDILSF